MLRRRFLPLCLAAPAAFQTQPRLQQVPAEDPVPASRDSGPFAGRRWKLQYLHEEDKWAALLAGLCSPSPERALAALWLESDFRTRSAALVSRDSGASWKEVPLAEKPLSLFSLDDNHIWAVGEKSLWISAESGYSWSRIPLPKTPRRNRPQQVFFLSPSRGWAFGPGKTFYSTADGGASWKPVPESQAVQLKDENTVWTSMAFLDSRHGLIAGFSDPRLNEEERFPGWMLPEGASRRKLLPISTVAAETRDGGTSWKVSVTSTFGRVARLRAAGNRSLAIYHYSENFPFPSEVYLLDFTTGGSRSIFRRRDLWVHDAVLLPGGGAILAAIQVAGGLRSTPVPGKLRVVYSADLEKWAEMAVDYRAEGHRAFLAAPAPGVFWAAAAAGCILRLV
ncbi:MAG: WD40/YVTN/BNR-like repeat-containing protein [Acidobacteriota bacterium]